MGSTSSKPRHLARVGAGILALGATLALALASASFAPGAGPGQRVTPGSIPPYGTHDAAYLTYHHAPDTSAAIFWLRNRRREDWREQVEHRHSTSHELLVVLEAARRRARPGMGERSGEAAPVAALPAPAEGNVETEHDALGARKDGDVRRD